MEQVNVQDGWVQDGWHHCLRPVLVSHDGRSSVNPFGAGARTPTVTRPGNSQATMKISSTPEIVDSQVLIDCQPNLNWT